MKRIGRPVSTECDAAEKLCGFCGRIFHLREQRFQSLRRFNERKFCSTECMNKSRRTCLPLGENFWRYVDRRLSGCWEWLGRRNKQGYGLFKVGSQHFRAHRYAYQLAHGEIPDGKMILHSCDNPPCCNPDHLRPGTALENANDVALRGRRRVQTAKQTFAKKQEAAGT